MENMKDHKGHNKPKEPPKEPPHNMMVVGEKTIFLSHLPMFMTPHNFQVILEATFTSKGKDVSEIYFKDRHANRETRMYTLEPQDSFKLPSLFTPRPPARTSFKATIFRGHLERGGETIRDLTNIDVNIKRVVYSRQLTSDLIKSDELSYLLFGSRQELFMAHIISRPPDFDQILSVKISNAPTDEDLANFDRVVIHDRQNIASRRIKESEQVVGQGHVTGAHQFLELQIQGDREFYLEEGELS